MQAVQALHQQAPTLTQSVWDSLEPYGSIQERPTWITRPPISERGKQRMEALCLDHDSTQGEALHPFYQKILKIKDHEDLLDQRLLEMS